MKKKENSVKTKTKKAAKTKPKAKTTKAAKKGGSKATSKKPSAKKAAASVAKKKPAAPETKTEAATPAEATTPVTDTAPAHVEKRKAYVAVIDEDGTHRLGIVVEGEKGYHKTKEDSDAGGPITTREEALKIAEAYNESLGLSPLEAAKIVASTMPGPQATGATSARDGRPVPGAADMKSVWGAT